LILNGGEYRNRTGLHGFAIRCITYLPTRHLGAGYMIDWIGARYQKLTFGPLLIAYAYVM
jgi:hypothetical protein